MRGPPALVAAVGHDKAGALAVLQQSIVPDLVTETPVTGVHALPLHPVHPWQRGMLWIHIGMAWLVVHVAGDLA